jgi:glycosyltransferase involved in cell wall biosynthesis
VIGVSDYNRRCMTTLDLLPADRFECIYNSVDLSRVDRSAERAAGFRRTHAIPSNRKLITQVSWLIPEKGIPDLLQATALVVAKDKDVQLALVGDGAHRDEYQRLATQLGLNGHVTWAGLIQDPFAEGVYDAADVVCQVSRWQEAFGWVLAEAMASKKPVIGTTVGGIPEIIQDGKSGYLIDPGSPERLAEKLTRLLGDEALRRQMGEAGCEIVKQKFELQKNVARLLELYGITRKG